MRHIVALFVYTCCMLTAAHSGDINAQSGQGTLTSTTTQSGTTNNLITNTWTGVGAVGTRPTDCCTSLSGSQPLYDPGTNTIHFSYGQATVGQAIAINNALTNSGVQINGYNWSYELRNNNAGSSQGGTDSITSYSYMTSNTGAVLLSNTLTHSTKLDWQTHSGTRTANTAYPLSSLGSLGIQFTSKDSGFWAGYYGPEVRNVNMSLNFGAAPIHTYTMPDDGWINVPLQFGFPFYGKVFTNSFMFDNGVVGFFDPVAGGCNPSNGYCGGQQWNAQPFSNNMSNQFSYMIAPLWADIAPIAGTTTYQTQGDATYQRYMWNNVAEYYSAYSATPRLNSFGLEIKPSGFIGASYGNINLQTSNIGIGTIGNPALGEYNQIGFHPYGTQITALSNWSLNNTPDACSANPLSSTSCPGYTTAMCSVNPLYSQTCPGYAQAYFTQQCSANALYDPNCPGYAVAYLNYQCSVNPLYSTTCDGYETAYFNQQCSLNPLYSTQCTGYAQAYKSQQCSLNPLYATDCPGYAQAYFTQQCNLNGLYDRTCPNYAEAYAKANILNTTTTTTTTVVADASTTTSTAGSVSSTGTVATTTEAITTQISSGITDSTVSSVVTTKTTSTNSEASPAAAVKLTSPSTSSTASPTSAVTQAETKKEETKKEETKKNETSTTNATASSDSKSSDGPKTTRQELAERRKEAAQKEAISKGKELANEMGKAADMETQKAVQNVVIQAMGFTPGFDAYKIVTVPDAIGYKPFEIYKGQRNVDNPAGRRFLTGSDRLHTEMVDQQYKLGN